MVVAFRCLEFGFLVFIKKGRHGPVPSLNLKTRDSLDRPDHQHVTHWLATVIGLRTSRHHATLPGAAALSNLVNSGSQVNGTLSTGPFRNLAMCSSHLPG